MAIFLCKIRKNVRKSPDKTEKVGGEGESLNNVQGFSEYLEFQLYFFGKNVLFRYCFGRL